MKHPAFDSIKEHTGSIECMVARE